MRTGSSDTPFLGLRRRSRLDWPLKDSRKSRLRRIEIEHLESRTLLATTPAATATAAPVNLSGLTSADLGFEDADSPVVAVNPYNASEVVAVWIVDVPPLGESFAAGAFTINGGGS